MPAEPPKAKVVADPNVPASTPAANATPAWMVAVAPLDEGAALPPSGNASMPPAEVPPAPARASAQTDDGDVAAPSVVSSLAYPPPASPSGRIDPAPQGAEPAQAEPVSGATTLLLRVAPDVASVDDLNGRRITTGDADPADRDAMAATLRSLSVTPDLVSLPPEEAENRLHAGDVAAIATLADDGAAAQAPVGVLKLRLDPYVVQRRRPPS